MAFLKPRTLRLQFFPRNRAVSRRWQLSVSLLAGALMFNELSVAGFESRAILSSDFEGRQLGHQSSYNALNQINTTQSGSGSSRTNEWDTENRLTAVNSGNQRTEFTYDGLSRLMGIRQLVNGSETSHRLFVWCDDRICEERDGSGTLVKRFFDQGVQMVTGPTAGSYFYTRDHESSIRELTDSSGNVRVRYAYDPFGQRTKLTGDLDADFGFTGMFWSSEAGLAMARFRAYDPALGRWLSRDPIENAEYDQGPNLYQYAVNNPVNVVDPSGLCCETEAKVLDSQPFCSGDSEQAVLLCRRDQLVFGRQLQQLKQCLLQCGKCPPAPPSGSPPKPKPPRPHPPKPPRPHPPKPRPRVPDPGDPRPDI